MPSLSSKQKNVHKKNVRKCVNESGTYLLSCTLWILDIFGVFYSYLQFRGERWSGWVLEDGCTGGANRLVAPFESEKLHLIMVPIFCWGLIWHPSLRSSPWTYFLGRMRNGPPVPDGREDSGVFLTKSFKESVFNSVPHLDTWSSKALLQFVLGKLIKVF